ncbi:MAG: formate dehydrogenase accessory protein FdhE [Dissulfurispiraceae bacterium]|jgi:FdhE protein|nr:formate dehydrogenase accessory protein FdhE [Dissulfurispiraceae bacterium]
MTIDSKKFDKWISDHPYLKETADFECLLSSVLDKFADSESLEWNEYAERLSSGAVLITDPELKKRVVSEAAAILNSAASELARSCENKNLSSSFSELSERFSQDPNSSVNLMEAVLEKINSADTLSGILRFLAWRSIERVVRPWRKGLEEWLAGSSWTKTQCPFCGNPPAMAQLVHTSNGRQKFLSCGCCRTRWKFMRMSCAFCGTHEQAQLDILETDNNEDLRLDLCRHCNSYIKTYTNEGNEDLMLSDWSSLHLDVIASEKGLKRSAHSLYEF